MKTSRRFTQLNRVFLNLRIATAVTLLSAAAAMAFVATNPSGPRLLGKSDNKAKAELQAQGLRSKMLGRLETLKGFKNGGEGPANEAAQEDYDNRAFPATAIGAAQTRAAANAAKKLGKFPGGKKTNWQEVGPSGVPADALVASESTSATRGTVYSGRATAIAISPNCKGNDCKIFIGAAGGGVWAADNALAPQLNWHPSSNGITSNAIGSLIFDPNDPSGKTLYAGTGEPNGRVTPRLVLGYLGRLMAARAGPSFPAAPRYRRIAQSAPLRLTRRTQITFSSEPMLRDTALLQ